MEFKLSEGPWKEMFKGTFESYDVEIYTNPESLILVSILEKEAGEIKGAVVELYKVFHATGELHGFIETLPRKIIAITSHTKTKTTQFFILGSKPEYTIYKQDEFSDEVDSIIKKVKASTKMLLDVSKAYDIELKPLHDSPEAIKQEFFSQPLIVPLLSTSPGPSTGTAPVSTTGKAISFGELVLGITKDGRGVKEPLSLFDSTIISGGSEKERAHALHVLAEGALLSNIPVVVLDWNKKFQGLSNRTSEGAGLAKYKVKIDPIGFPIKDFAVPEQMKVDLDFINKKGLMQIVGMGESIAGKEIEKTMNETEAKGMLDMIKAVKGKETAGEFNEFQRNRWLYSILRCTLKQLI